MVTHMKTTIEISDALFEEAKARAARDKTTLRALVEEGLRRMLAKDPAAKSGYVMPDRSFRGDGLQPGITGEWEQIRDILYKDRGA